MVIRDFSNIAKPMNLCCRRREMGWGAGRKALITLKRHYSSPVLVLDDARISSKRTARDTQQGRSCRRCETTKVAPPVAFISKGLSPRNETTTYTIKRCSPSSEALEQWWHYLEGAKTPRPGIDRPQKSRILHGHSRSSNRPAGALVHVPVARFDLDLSYRPGKSSVTGPPVTSRGPQERC